MRRRRGGRRRGASEQIEQSPPGEAAELTTVEAAEGPLSSCQPAAERLGIRRLYPEQERTVAASLAGHDVLVVLPTGFGKSACYQVPSMVLPRPVVLVSPLLALHPRPAREAAGAAHSGRTSRRHDPRPGAAGGAATHRGRRLVAGDDHAGDAGRQRARGRPAQLPASRWPRSTRRTASPSGATTSARRTCASASACASWARHRSWR